MSSNSHKTVVSITKTTIAVKGGVKGSLKIRAKKKSKKSSKQLSQQPDIVVVPNCPADKQPTSNTRRHG